jgi:pimeloyl-ACP methyl ester carboxylesterase
MMRRTLWCGLLAAGAVAQAAGAQAFFDSAGVRIRYTDEGSGTPVVLVHGFSLNFDLNWVKPGIVADLCGKYRVIGIDLRGHGRSGKPHEPKQYGPAMADDVVQLLDHLKIRQAHVAGYSLGGRIAARLMADHPDRLLSAVVAGAGAAGDTIAERRALMLRVAESAEKGNGLAPLLEDLSPSGRKPSPEQTEMLRKLFHSINDPLAIAAVARSAMDLEASEAKLRRYPGPLLIIVGELDPRKADAERLKALLPKAELRVIPGANHQNAFAKPEFRDSLKAFLDRR